MKYQVMPDLTAEEYEELKADIAARGVMVPIEFDENKNVLDGHHRLRACDELGIKDYPKVIRAGMTEVEKLTHALKLNTLRRQLGAEAKKNAIKDFLKKYPQVSDRRIANAVGVSNPTVSATRKIMEEKGEVLKINTSIGADGKQYPRKVERKQEPKQDLPIAHAEPRKPVSVFNPTPREEKAVQNPAVVERMAETNAKPLDAEKQEILDSGDADALQSLYDESVERQKENVAETREIAKKKAIVERTNDVPDSEKPKQTDKAQREEPKNEEPQKTVDFQKKRDEYYEARQRQIDEDYAVLKKLDAVFNAVRAIHPCEYAQAVKRRAENEKSTLEFRIKEAEDAISVFQELLVEMKKKVRN